MRRGDLLKYLDGLLEPDKFDDYAPNGLQVEGKDQIQKIACAVSATRAVIEKAARSGADALLVHHGWFWKNEPRPVTGIRYERMRLLTASQMNLLAYHLPLDAHPKIGNNAVFALKMGILRAAPSKKNPFLWIGEVRQESEGSFYERLGALFGHAPILLGHAKNGIKRVGWCSGAGADFLLEASELGAQAFVTGEAQERTTHEARESGTACFVCGHYATETLGIRALGETLERSAGLETFFIEDENPL